MDPREKIVLPKKLTKSTSWSAADLPPRCSVFPRSQKMPPGWEWKSASAIATDGTEFLLLIKALPRMDKWSAMLAIEVPHGRSVIACLEQHGASNEGIHVHADCDGDLMVVGPESIHACHTGRLPADPTGARRMTPWTRASFWDYACKTFRIEQPTPRQTSMLDLWSPSH